MPTDADSLSEEWRALLGGARSRETVAHGGFSGAPLERVLLASGATVIVKRCSPAADGMAKIMRDEGRLLELWRNGVFARMPSIIDHAMLAVIPDGDGWLIVMRDVGEAFHRDDEALSRDEIAFLLSALDHMHETFLGEQVDGACPIDDYVAHSLPHGAAGFPRWGQLVDAAWQAFTSSARSDMVDLVAQARADPAIFSRSFARCEQTLIHGDVDSANAGFLDGRLVLVDWSQVTTAPPALDIATFLISCEFRSSLGASKDEILADYRAIAGDRCSAESLAIGLIGAFSLAGPFLAYKPPALEWWTERVRQELERPSVEWG